MQSSVLHNWRIQGRNELSRNACAYLNWDAVYELPGSCYANCTRLLDGGMYSPAEYPGGILATYSVMYAILGPFS